MRDKYTYRYSVDEADFDNSYELKSLWGENDPDMVAEDAGEDCWNNHDGWDCTWPLDFTIFTADGKCLGTFEVEMETVPEFSASEKKV